MATLDEIRANLSSVIENATQGLNAEISRLNTSNANYTQAELASRVNEIQSRYQNQINQAVQEAQTAAETYRQQVATDYYNNLTNQINAEQERVQRESTAALEEQNRRTAEIQSQIQAEQERVQQQVRAEQERIQNEINAARESEYRATQTVDTIPMVETTTTVTPTNTTATTTTSTNGADISISYSEIETIISQLKKGLNSLKSNWNGVTANNIAKLEASWIGDDCKVYIEKVKNMETKVNNAISAIELLISTYTQAINQIKESQASIAAAIANYQ